MTSDKRKKYVNNVAFLCRLRTPTKVIIADVPYLSAISKDATKIYINPRVRRFWVYKGKRIDIFHFLIMYERARKALIDLFGINPEEAHEIATWEVEADFLRKRRIKWEDYDKYLSPQMTPIGKLKNVPPDLDLSRYNDKDKLILNHKRRLPSDDSNLHQRKLSSLHRNKTTPNIK